MSTLVSSLDVAMYDCLLHRFFPNVSSNFQLTFKPVIFNFSFNPVAGNILPLLEISLLFNSVTSAVTA